MKKYKTESWRKFCSEADTWSTPYKLIVSKLKLKKTYFLLTLQKWENEWQSSLKGLITKMFFPNIEMRNKIELMHNFKTTQYFTGHRNFNAYLMKFKRSVSGKCQCEKADETVTHIIFECEEEGKK